MSITVLGVPAVIGAVRLLLTAHRPFDGFGDEAILESAVRHASQQLVGPYSRFGFHQPGPAYFYLQAPFYRAGGGSAAALFLGAFCINVGSAVGCVLVTRRFLGERTARWTGAVVGALLLCLTPQLLANPWNPYVLALPVLLGGILGAAATTGSLAAGGGALLVASYVAQTHIAAAPTLGVMFAAALLTGGAMRLKTGRAPVEPGRPRRAGLVRRWPLLIGLAGLLGLVWAPPLVEQATHSPGNLGQLVRFFRTPHPEFDKGIDHGLAAVGGQVAAELTVLPFGHDVDPEPTAPGKVGLASVAIVAAALVVVAGWRRRQPVVVALGAMSVAGPLAAVWSGTRIVGDVFPYLLLWTSTLLLPGAIGAGWLFLSRPARSGAIGRMAGTVVAAGAVAVGLVLAGTMVRHALIPYPTSTDVPGAARLAEPWLAGHRAHEVRIRIGDHDRWPLASGVAVRLEKDGVRTTVDPEWTSVFGDHFGPTSHEQAAIWITDIGGHPPPGGATVRLGVVGDASVWAGLASAAGPG